MKLVILTILTAWLICSGNISGQIEADTSGTAVVIGKSLFKDIITKLAERNTYQEDATLLEKEVDIMDQELFYKDEHIKKLKQDNDSIAKQLLECGDRPFYDNFFWGFAGAAILMVISITVGLLIKF